MKKIFITGVSGTGKTTVAEALNVKGVHSISIDEVPELCYWKNKITGVRVGFEHVLNIEFIDAHDWVCDIELLKKLLQKKEEIIVVLGIASNQEKLYDMFDKVLLLQCSPATFISRIEKRENNDFGKEKSAQESILGWYKKFETDLLQKGAIAINAEQPVDKVVDNIIDIINS